MARDGCGAGSCLAVMIRPSAVIVLPRAAPKAKGKRAARGPLAEGLSRHLLARWLAEVRLEGIGLVDGELDGRPAPGGQVGIVARLLARRDDVLDQLARLAQPLLRQAC